MYLIGAQLMVLAIQPAALLAFDFIDSTAVYALQIEAQKTDALLPILFQSVLDYIPLSPIKKF